MKTRFFLTLLLVAFMEVHVALGHAWSEQMKQELNAQPPEWLSIGAPIRVDPVDKISDEPTAFRPVSGDSQSTRDRVTIPSRGIEIRVDYPIRWYRGSSLSPDGTRLIINSGMRSKVYEMLSDGGHRPVVLRLPYVTYDDGPKGYITCWSWVDDKTLVGEAEIDTEKGEFIERRIYVFHINESALSRLDVSSLNLPTTEGLTVSKVGLELDRLRISVGNSEFTVKADLKSSPRIEKKEADAPTATAPLVAFKKQAPKAPEPKPASPTSEAPASSTPWSIIVVLIVAALGLFWMSLKKRK
ncbi:hypothetical protein HNR46_004177 [Haloferula luteola]|uniref:Uncharacterized protein n=1 Tax=Haloferula luteola TaxID=595692 RepID=A0A840V7F8_9BACT|nr:hypothetical protein [Haloferula luteola]MBB5353912.1 hypothetical protein [Haloferula luteola]